MTLAAIACFGVATVNAQNTNTNTNTKKAESTTVQPQTERVQDQNKQITKAELPAAVKETLANDKYAGWEVQNAWMTKNRTYLVEVKKDNETKRMEVGADGKMVNADAKAVDAAPTK